MNTRLMKFLLMAAAPVVLLAILYPHRFFGGVDIETSKYVPSPGADIVAYVRDGCPHCADFYEFAKQKGWEVDYREITQINAQQRFSELQDITPALNQGVPTFVLDGHVYQGYETNDTSGTGLEKVYDACRASADGCLSYKDFVATAENVEVQMAGETCLDDCEDDSEKYRITVMGYEINLLEYSLPGLALMLGFLDGFNPCAMWVLITLLTLLINTHDMKKVWVIGGTFLFISGAVYYFFIAAWLNVFLLIGFNSIVQKIIGLVALGGGAFYLYEAFGKNPNECKVTNMSQRQKTIAKMKKLLEISEWPALIIGVSILAISVNMIELVCTAGLPAVFTQILAFNDVSNAYRYFLIGLFILMYMIDDVVIFAIAVATLHASGLTTKYRRFTLIFGGCLMYGLGILLIFAPEALTFDPTL